MRKRYIAFVFGLVALVTYLAMESIKPSHRKSASTADEPEFTVKGLKASLYNEDGLLSQKIEAQSAEHIADTKNTLFKAPSVILSEGPKPQWALSAQQGLLQDDKTLLLSGNVQISPMDSELPAYVLTTDELNIDLRNEIAETDSLVVIEGSGTYMQATGMALFLKEERVTFLSEVRGRHDPNTRALNF